MQIGHIIKDTVLIFNILDVGESNVVHLTIRNIHVSLWCIFRAGNLVFIELKVCSHISSSILSGFGILKSTHSANSHLVGSEGASLIGTNNAGATQCLNRGQRTHNGIFARHATGTQGKTCCYYGRKTFGYCSNSQSNCNFEIINSATNPRSTMSGIVKVTDIDYPNSDANKSYNLL